MMRFSSLLLLSPLALAKPCTKRSFSSIASTTSSAAYSTETSSSSYIFSSSSSTPSFSVYPTSSSFSSGSSSSYSSSVPSTSSAVIISSSTVTSASTTTAAAAAYTNQCGVTGQYPSSGTYRLDNVIEVSLEACTALCITSSACLSYVYSTFLGGCSTYSINVLQLGADGSSDNYHFYDVGCDLTATTTSSTITSAAVIPATTMPAVATFITSV
ncbi:hypothetical protein GGR53DRAFT_498793 [Hypoxylon sp. FL1150]|nr:hypothetical protein GGR53DRAFT_498793 [Hypoxylon sp. FL1150]